MSESHESYVQAKFMLFGRGRAGQYRRTLTLGQRLYKVFQFSRCADFVGIIVTYETISRMRLVVNFRTENAPEMLDRRI